MGNKKKFERSVEMSAEGGKRVVKRPWQSCCVSQCHSLCLNEENLLFNLRLQGSERLWVSQVKSSRKFPNPDGFAVES